MTSRTYVRPANPRDAEQIVDLESEVFDRLLSHQGPKPSLFARVHVMRQAALLGRDFAHVHLVAESNRKVVGYALGRPYTLDNRQFFPWSSVYFLNQIAVGEAYQKQGVGDLLLNTLIRKVRSLGYSTLAANVNEESAEFYAKAGWSISAQGEGLAWVDSASKEDVALLPNGSVFSEIAALRVQPPHAAAGYSLMAYKTLLDKPGPPVWFIDAADDEQAVKRHVASLVNKDRSLIGRIHISVMLEISQQLVHLVGQAETEAILVESLTRGTVSLADRNSFLRNMQAAIQYGLVQGQEFRKVSAA